MTRINTIDPKDLLDQWLIAEWRELPRVINELVKHANRFKINDIPKNYTLSTGHVKFFRNKGVYLVERHEKICDEMTRRGFKFDRSIKPDYTSLTDAIRVQVMQVWRPAARDHTILIERLKERYSLRKRAYTMTDYHQYKIDIDDQVMSDLYFYELTKKYC